MKITSEKMYDSRNWLHFFVFFAFLSFFLIPRLCYAQGTVNLNTLTGSQIVSGIQTGSITIPNAAQFLSTTAGISLPSADTFVQSLAGQINIPQAGLLFDTLKTGKITPTVALSLAGLPNLGGLSSLTDIQTILSSPNIAAAIQGLGFNTTAISDFVKTIVDISGGAQGLITAAANAANIGSLVNSLIPGLPPFMQSLITNAITTALGGAATLAVTGGVSGGAATPHTNCQCQAPIAVNHQRIRDHFTLEFQSHREWFVNDYFFENILPSLQLMAMELTTVAMQQVTTIGMFFDAKHQLETQRLFQILTAEAHKDYHPSEGMCVFGTNTRSLAASERKADFAQRVFSERNIQRQLLAADTLGGDPDKEKENRIKDFIEKYCDPRDNGNGLVKFCQGTTSTPLRRNKDINYTQTIENQLTLDTDFTQTGAGTLTPDEEDVFAISANLYAHDVLPFIDRRKLADENLVTKGGAGRYLDLRAIAAKRSVAYNSFAALAAMRTEGEPGVTPFLYKIVADLGVSPADIQEKLGANPSYFAQTHVLNKYLLQNPQFYTDLYDKPANVERKGAVLQALALSQDRDTFKSLLRSEASLSVLLETLLQKEHRRITGRLGDVTPMSAPFDRGSPIGAGP